MRYAIAISLLVSLLAVPGRAQNDFGTYPIRPLAALVQEHDTPENKNTDFVVSADPFPSKTAVTVTGEHRPISKQKRDYILLWFETRNLPKERANGLVNEYRFIEGDKEYWLPVVAPLEPFLEKELKKGDLAVLYYFFMGGYSKTAREWVFVVEEFHKVQS